ncbi:hypothetical protein MtrunA17_Chr3g0136981 [Medicago truncatula]|uniref:Transmembrane protein n=1 Tax=Medicago truncatula TaxID=3880 RepID=A0A396J1H6_MEDTR|nr:hypothetical protein MtrunA17_Chr3g0136981 [Medicago truncatula]
MLRGEKHHASIYLVVVWFYGGSINITSQCSTTVIFKKLKIVALGRTCVYA